MRNIGLLALFTYLLFSATVRADSRCSELDLVTRVRCLFRVAPEILELSGSIVTTQNGKEYFWSMGDGGNGEKLGVSQLGDPVPRVVPISGSHNEDWEALAYDAQKNEIYIMDVGANNAPRASVQYYVVSADPEATRLPVIHKGFLEWPGGKSRDVEAAIIVGSELVLFTKVLLDGSEVYHAPTGQKRVQLKRLGALAVDAPSGGALTTVTDAAINGDKLGFLSYFGLFECDFNELRDALHAKDNRIICERSLKQLTRFRASSGQGKIQFESLAASQSGDYLVGREDGRVFLFRGTHFK